MATFSIVFGSIAAFSSISLNCCLVPIGIMNIEVASTPIVSSIVRISPNSKFIAYISGVKCFVVNAFNSQQVIETFSCLDKIDNFMFSNDSDRILCVLKERSIVQAFSISDKSWKCRINEGPPGIIHAFWSSDGYSIITESDFGAHLAVWSLTENQKYIIANPKSNIWHLPEDLYQPILSVFSESTPMLMSAPTDSPTSPIDHGHTAVPPLNHSLFAVVHRYDLKDYIAVYSQDPWQELIKFQCRTNDVAMVQWVSNKALLVTADSPLTYQVCVYTLSGEALGVYSPYQNALGVRNISIFTPAANFTSSKDSGTTLNLCHSLISVGSYDGKIRLLTQGSARESFVLPLLHPRMLGPALVYSTDLYSSMEGKIHQQSAGTSNVIADGTTAVGIMNGSILVECPVDSTHTDACGHDTNIENSVSRSNASLSRQSHQSQQQQRSIDKLSSRNRSDNDTANKSTLPSSDMLLNSKVFQPETCFLVKNAIRSLPAIQLNPRDERQALKFGAVWHGWSHNGEFLAARDGLQNRCLWVYNMNRTVKLHHLFVMLEPIVCAQWRPARRSSYEGRQSPSDGSTVGGNLSENPLNIAYNEEDIVRQTSSNHHSSGESQSSPQSESQPSSTLAFCTGTSRVYFWNPDLNQSKPFYKDIRDLIDHKNTSASTLAVVRRIEWSSDGAYLMCHGRDSFTVCRVEEST